LERFNDLPSAEAEAGLYGCLANRVWAARVTAGRPYSDLDSLLAAAQSAASQLTPEEWLATFAAHPRIGEAGGHAPGHSEREQNDVAQSPSETLAALAAENRMYESRFGHVFLIAASGRGAADILEELRSRMKNDPDVELRVAADEHRKITRLRLERLIGD
jgi:OHCU decarboxylase